MALIRVAPSSLRGTADELSTMGKQLQTIVERLSEFEENLNVSWEGAANDAFHKAFLYDKDFMVMFYQLIGLYSEAMRQIAANYEEAEQRSADLASRRSHGGGGGRSEGGSTQESSSENNAYPFTAQLKPGPFNPSIFTTVLYAAPQPFTISNPTAFTDVVLKPVAFPSDMQ